MHCIYGIHWRRPKLGQSNFDMFYKIYCWAVTRDHKWMTNVPYTSHIIMLPSPDINSIISMISHFDFWRLRIVSNVHCIYTEENPKQAILTYFTKLIAEQSPVTEYEWPIYHMKVKELYSYSLISVLWSDLNFERFSIVSLFPFYVHCIYTEENPKLGQSNFDMFCKIDCCAVIRQRIWMTNIPYESKGIILLFSDISFMISDLNFERFSVVSLYPFYVHCIYTEENRKQAIWHVLQNWLLSSHPWPNMNDQYTIWK